MERDVSSIMRCSILLVFWVLLSAKPLQARDLEITDPRLRDITNTLKQICHVPSRRGEYWDVKLSGQGEAKVKLLGLDLEATLSKGQWNGVREALTPEGQVADRASARECIQKLAPIFIEKFAGASSYQVSAVNLVGTWIYADGGHYWVVRPGPSRTYAIELYTADSNQCVGEGSATAEAGKVNFSLHTVGNHYVKDVIYMMAKEINGRLEYRGDWMVGETDELTIEWLEDPTKIAKLTLIRAQ